MLRVVPEAAAWALHTLMLAISCDVRVLSTHAPLRWKRGRRLGWQGGRPVSMQGNVEQNGEEVGQRYVLRIMLCAICFPSLTVLEKALVLVDGSAREWAADSEPSILS